MPAVEPAEPGLARPATRGLLYLPLIWFVLAVPSTLKAVPVWSDATGLFLRSLGEADPWSWAGFGRAAGPHAIGSIAIIAILLGALAAGWPVPRWIGVPASPAGRFAFRLVSGFGVAAMVQQGLGLAGLMSAGILRAEALLLAAAGAGLALRSRWLARVPVGAARWPAAAAAVVVVASFALTRLPDTHDDPRTYHFAAPESYLNLHKIRAEPLNVNWHMPLGAEMSFALGWVWGDIEGAKLMNLGFLAALLLVTFRLATRLTSARGVSPSGETPAPASAGAWAVGWLLTAGLVTEECWQGKNDLLLAAFVAAAAWCAAEAVAGGRSRWWLGATWFLGNAAGVKFTAGFFVAGLLVAAFLAGRRSLPWRSLPVAAGLGALPGAGWLTMSWIFLGDPFHPFLSGTFPDLGWGPRYQKALSDIMLTMSPASARRPIDLVLAPWRAWGDPRTGSLALMTLAPVGLILVRSRPAVLLRWFALAAYLLWLSTERNARYLFPLVPVLAAFAGAVCEPGRRAGALAIRALLAAAAVMALLTAGLHLVPDGWSRVTGQMGRSEFLARQFTTWEGVRRWANAALPPGSRVLFTGEERRLWFRPDVRSAYTVHEPVFWKLTRDSFTPAGMRKRVRQAGFTHQLHNFVSADYRAIARHPGPPWSDRQIALYRGFTGMYLRPVRGPDRVDHANGGFWVFAFDRTPTDGGWPLYFLPLTEGSFYRVYRLYNTGHLAEAVREAEMQAARFGGVSEAQLILARVYIATEEEAKMDAILRPLAGTGFIGDGSLKHAATAALAAGRIEEGLRGFVRAWLLTRDPDLLRGVAHGLYLRGKARYARGAYAAALRDFDIAARCVPNQPAVLFECARALAMCGRREEALATALRAFREDPADRDIRALMTELTGRPF